MLVGPKEEVKMGRTVDTSFRVVLSCLPYTLHCSLSCVLGLLCHNPGSHFCQRSEPGLTGPAAGERWCCVASVGSAKVEHQGGV